MPRQQELIELWDQTYRAEIGEKLKAKLPDGRIVPVWQLWAAVVRTPGEPGVEAQNTVSRLKELFGQHIPEVPANQRLMRAARIFLQSVAFEVSGHDGDAHDLKVLALYSGLSTEEFKVTEVGTEPHLVLNEYALAKAAGTNTADEALEKIKAAIRPPQDSLLPQFQPNPDDPEGCLMNVSAVIELARMTDTPKARRLLKKYHAAEADVASEFPFWSERRIREEAGLRALQGVGIGVRWG